MSSVGQVSLNGLNIRNNNELSGLNNRNSNELSGLNLPPVQQNNYPVYTNTQTYTNTNYGNVPPTNNNINFSDDIPQNTSTKKVKSEDDKYMSVGIGMAIGAVAGGIAGSFIAPGAGTVAGLGTGAKIGALVGVAIGGFVANTFSK